MGIFLTRDPHGGVPSRPASRNGYGYVEGNPTNWTDPSGENPLVCAVPALLPFCIKAAEFAAAVGVAVVVAVTSYAAGQAVAEHANNRLPSVSANTQRPADAIRNWFAPLCVKAHLNATNLQNGYNTSCAYLPEQARPKRCNDLLRDLERALRYAEQLDWLREASSQAADALSDAAQRLERTAERTAQDENQSCLYSVRQILDNPVMLSVLTPDDVRCAFQIPNSLPGRWQEEPARSRSGGITFYLLSPEGIRSGVTIRWSTGETRRHFEGAYWKTTVANGNPSSLWIAPNGTLWLRPPETVNGTPIYGQEWHGRSLLPLPQPFHAWAFGE